MPGDSSRQERGGGAARRGGGAARRGGGAARRGGGAARRGGGAARRGRGDCVAVGGGHLDDEDNSPKGDTKQARPPTACFAVDSPEGS
jgi:hypothetical protein